MKMLKISTAVVVSTIVLFLAYFFNSIPRSEIRTLSKGYVEVKVEDVATYNVTTKKPATWIPLSDISKKAWQAIMISEDWAFFEHSGVDYAQLVKAIEEYTIEGKNLRGASTISQQVVKNVFFGPEKTLNRKLKEAFSTYYLEKHIDKEKILEIYLNIVHLGPGIYGIKEASLHYFNKQPNELTALEGSFLAYLLPNPNLYYSTFKNKKLTEFSIEKIGKILGFLKIAKFINDDELITLKQELLHFLQDKKSQIRNKEKLKETINKIKNNKGPRRIRLKKVKNYENKFKRDNDLELDQEPVLEGLDDEPQLDVIEAEFSDD